MVFGRSFMIRNSSCLILLVLGLFTLLYLGFAPHQYTSPYSYFQTVDDSRDADIPRFLQETEDEEEDHGIEENLGNSTETFTKTTIESPTVSAGTECSLKFLFADFHASKYGGGVGNFMFEWMSFLGIAKAINRIPALHVRNDMVGIMLKWQKSFPNILDMTSIKLLRGEKNVEIPYKGCCKFTDPVEVYKKHSNVVNVFTRLVYMQSYFYLKPFTRAEILDLLLFHEADKKVAREEMVPSKFNINQTYNVCLHIRRGDFVKSKLHQHSTEEFTASAIRFGVQYAKNRTKKAVSAILLGNDLTWERNLIQSMGELDFPVLAANQNEKYWVPHIDWVFSQIYCDTVILTASASTYGWWLAYVSRGNDVLYNKRYSRKDGVEKELDEDKFWPKYWQRIDQNEKTKVISFA